MNSSHLQGGAEAHVVVVIQRLQFHGEPQGLDAMVLLTLALFELSEVKPRLCQRRIQFRR